jgi:hypothetical protein
MGQPGRRRGSTRALAATHSKIHPRQHHTQPHRTDLASSFFLLGCEAFENKYPALRRALSDLPNRRIGGRLPSTLQRQV